MIRILVSESSTKTLISQARNRVLVSEKKTSVVTSQRRNRILIGQKRIRVLVSTPDAPPIKGTAISWFNVLVKWADNIFATWK